MSAPHGPRRTGTFGPAVVGLRVYRASRVHRVCIGLRGYIGFIGLIGFTGII